MPETPVLKMSSVFFLIQKQFFGRHFFGFLSLYNLDTDGYRLALKSNSLDPIGNTRHRCDTCGTILLNLKSLIDHEISTHHENRGKLHCGDCAQGTRNFDKKIIFGQKFKFWSKLQGFPSNSHNRRKFGLIAIIWNPNSV